MDRFIAVPPPLTFRIKLYLKSNMDRFIENVLFAKTVSLINLKSNMDRFIVIFRQMVVYLSNNLKSNMDRFIVFAPHDIENITGI